jgi:hypothetical protein
MIPFTRSLGSRSGVQLNPLADDTERADLGSADQNFAVAARFERGRIDKAFRVNRGNLYRKLGQPSSPTINRLNEAFVHVYDAFAEGAQEAVVARLNVSGAVNKVMYCDAASVTEAGVWSAPSSEPDDWTFSVQHMECFNEGVRMEVHAKQVLGTALDATAVANTDLTGSTPKVIGGVTIEDGMRVYLGLQTDPEEIGTYDVAVAEGAFTLTIADDEIPVASKTVIVRMRDVNTGALLYEFEGSLDPEAKNEFNETIYLPNIVAAQTDDVVVTVNDGEQVEPDATFYGKDEDGADIYVGEDLVYFTESSTSYDSEDYDRAMDALKYTEYQFGYIIGAGTQSTSLLSKLIALGEDINKQVIWDIPGSYAPSAAITFLNQLSIDTHYSQVYWSPLKVTDPVNGGKDYLGNSGLQVGMRCARNARSDANGIPPKNYPIAGKANPLSRIGVTQTYVPSESELRDLADAHINPVIFIRYNSGSRYVFFDSLTGAMTSGDKKLIAVAEMSSQVDDWVTAYAQEVLQLPMTVAIKKMTQFLQSLFEGLEAAGWIKPSAQLENRSFVAQVQANASRPSDRMDVNYWLKYDGTVRAIHVSQTLSK